MRFGDFDLTNKEDDIEVTERKVKDIVVHGKYDNFQAYNDVALVKMVPVSYTTAIRPICVPITTEYFNVNKYSSHAAIVAGWGAFDNSQSVVSKLRTGHVTIYDYR